MRLTAPAGFNVAEFYSDVPTFQAWEIFPNHRIAGAKPVALHLDVMGVPDRLDGARILEIGPWNGFFGFELVRRGASELVALGPDNPQDTGFLRTIKLLEIEDQVKYVQSSIYDIGNCNLGTFDVVMFLGVIYHLRYPLLALDLLHDHCGGQDTIILIDSPIIDPVHHVADEPDQPAIRDAWEAVKNIPLSTFVRGGVTAPLAKDAHNWFIPNSPCLRAWVISSGFAIEQENLAFEWLSIRARPVERPFTAGLEGFNPSEQAIP